MRKAIAPAPRPLWESVFVDENISLTPPESCRRARRCHSPLVGSSVADVVHDSLADRAYRKPFRVAVGDPRLSAQGPNGNTFDVRSHDVVFPDVVSDTVIIVRGLEPWIGNFLS